MSVPPPGMTQKRWVRLLDVCRQMDSRYDRAEDVGKPRLTCENAPKRAFDDGTMASPNETGPGAVDAASRPLATGPEQEGR